MTWSISASGTKADVVQRITESSVSSNAEQHDLAKQYILDALAGVDDSVASVSVSASGHAPDDKSGVTANITISAG